MKKYYKISKVKNSKGEKVEYLQIWEGEAKGRGVLVRSVGTAEKLLSILVRTDPLEKLTKEYPELLTKLNEELQKKKD